MSRHTKAPLPHFRSQRIVKFSEWGSHNNPFFRQVPYNLLVSIGVQSSIQANLESEILRICLTQGLVKDSK